jgi:hypothetical protein
MSKKQERLTLIKTQRKNCLRQMQPCGLKKNLYYQLTNATVYQHQSAVQLVLNTHNASGVFSVVRNVHMVSALSWYAGSWKCVIHQWKCIV